MRRVVLLLNILVVHEVNYQTKPIYEFQILPEMLSLMGHSVTVVDYDDTWDVASNNHPSARRHPFFKRSGVFSSVLPGCHRAYPRATVTLRRPGMIRVPLLSRISGAVTSGLAVHKVLREKKADVILLYGLPTVGVQTLLAARAFRIPVVFRAIDVSHELVPHRILIPVTKLLERIVFQLVDFNVALTPHLRQYIHSYGIPEDKIRLLPSGVDAGMFSPGTRNLDMLRRWNIGPNDRVILFMGTIYSFSGLDVVIHGFDSILASHGNAKLLIVGSGEDETRLRNLAASEGLTRNVIFTGMQPYSILPDVIRSSDVCINPFQLNGVTQNILPTKLFQYMACAKPVLATSLPGTRTFLAGEDQGVVYAELPDFNNQLSALLSDEDKCGVLGRRGHEAASKYDWQSIAKTLTSWFEEVARG